MDTSSDGPDHSNVLDGGLRGVRNESVCLETEVCLAYARLLDDPHNNNIDCPWDWKSQDALERRKKDEEL